MTDSRWPELRAGFELGPWSVDPGLDRLARDGGSVGLEPRAMDLLVCLAERAGETVSKETLLEEVWHGAFVAEGVIPKTLSALRAALGDDAGSPSFIVTVPRRGYRLIAPVRPLATAAELSAPVDAAKVENAALSSRVAPFARSSPRKRWLLALLLLLLALSAGAGLWWQGARGVQPPAVAHARLAGPVEKLLLEARHLWSKRSVESVRRANDLLVEAVKEAPASAEVQGWLALSWVTRGNYLGDTAASYEKAWEHVERALALDPRSAIAHCAAGALAINRDHDIAGAVSSLSLAVELDPDLLAARQYLAEALSIAGRDAEALAAIDQAIRVEPLSAVLHGVRGLLLLRADRPLAALEEFDRVVVLEPEFGWVHRDRAWALLRLGREREACEAFYLEVQSAGEKPEFLAKLRHAIDREGAAGYWRWRLNRLETVRSEGLKIRPMQFAEALAGVGRNEDALVELARAAKGGDGEFFYYFRDSSAFDSLRADPRFIAIYQPPAGR